MANWGKSGKREMREINNKYTSNRRRESHVKWVIGWTIVGSIVNIGIRTKLNGGKTTGFSAKKSCARRRTAETHPFHEDEKGETFMHVSLLPTSLNQPRILFYSTDLWS